MIRNDSARFSLARFTLGNNFSNKKQDLDGRKHFLNIQLFWQRLSLKNAKLYAIIKIGFMCSGWVTVRVSAKRKGKHEYMCLLCCFLLSRRNPFRFDQAVVNQHHPQYLSTLSRTLTRFCKTTFHKTTIFSHCSPCTIFSTGFSVQEFLFWVVTYFPTSTPSEKIMICFLSLSLMQLFFLGLSHSSSHHQIIVERNCVW